MHRRLLFSGLAFAFAGGPAAWAQYTASQAGLQGIYKRLNTQLPQTVDGLSFDDAAKILERVKKNRVATLKRLADYDDPIWPLNLGEIGYCFGRAMTAQLELWLAKLKRPSVRKLFIAGDMTAADPGGSDTRVRWRFHVTTLVKDAAANTWWTIDPVVSEDGDAKVMKAADWMRMARKLFDENKTTKFYLTDANAVLVDMRVVPAAKEFENGERVIEVGFDPASKKTTRVVGEEKRTTDDFTKATADDGLGDLTGLEGLVWKASEWAQYKYFINVKDKFAYEKPEDGTADTWKMVTAFHDDAGEDFDFFGIRVMVLREKKVDGKIVPALDNHRWYRYFTSRGTYFAELLQQTEERAEKAGLL